ncbi:MAG: metallophosphoesterase [Methylococcales bacterium]
MLTRKHNFILLGIFFYLLCFQIAAYAQTIIRGPYLQQATPTSMVIRWRTDVATDSVVNFGKVVTNLSQSETSSNITTEHQVKLTGLKANTRYYYQVGNSSTVLSGGDQSSFLVTSPLSGRSKPTRIWVLGDSGKANDDARSVRDAYKSYTGTHATDLVLMLGDNAYTDGTDAEYQAAVFDMYPEILRQTALWPTFGNHDGISADSSNESGPYYNIFTLPRNAEAGGLASRTEAYYSFDYGNIHFISLDSTESNRSANGPMMTWLKNDLGSTNQKWVIAFWHHPPYSKGSHDSDTEFELISMREKVLPILESYNVDLVLVGHSHAYERSFLLNGHYGNSNTLESSMLLDSGDGQLDGDGSYQQNSQGKGTVYVVAGSSGYASSQGNLNHPSTYFSLASLGSLVLDVDGGRLDAKFLDAGGQIRDHFTLSKGEVPVEPQPPSPSPSPGANSIDVRVSSSSDDAEEKAAGNMYLDSSDLEMVFDYGDQQVGLRFNDINIPQGAIISRAYIQFSTDEANAGSTNLAIEGHAIDNAPTFASVANDISSRPRTADAVLWSPAAWTTWREVGAGQRTPELKAIIQGIVDRTGWMSGNSLAILVSGNGERTAESYDGHQVSAPLLHVEFSTENVSPLTVNAGVDQITEMPATVNLDGTITPSSTVITWSKVSGPGSVVFGSSNSVDTSATFSVPGVYVLRLTAVDGGVSQHDDVTMTINPEQVSPDIGGEVTVLDVRINAGSDDAEEKAAGRMYLDSSDIEMVFDYGDQKVGLRFNGIDIPRGATIKKAHIQFSTDEANAGVTNLAIKGQAADNARTFTANFRDISSRALTTSSVTWNPVPWRRYREAGSGQRTTDIAAIIQEIIDRGGWVRGNSLAILLNGSGERTGESYDGHPVGAPLLHIEYQSNP